jgi:signal transduction histidine kinase
LRRYLSPPIFEDEEQNRVVRLLNIFLWTTLIAAGLMSVVLWGFGGASRGIWFTILIILMTPVSMGLMRRGHLTASASMILLAVAVLLIYLPFRGDGLHDTVLVVYPALIIAASLLLKPRLLAFYVALLMFSVGLIAFGEIAGGIIVTNYDNEGSLRDAIVLISILAITAISVRILTGTLVDSLARTHRSERALAEINAHLQAEIDQRRQTEMALRESEALLWRRNQELNLLNQVGQELNATLDTVQVNERLLQAVVETIGAEGATIWFNETARSGPGNDAEPELQETGLICRAVFRLDRDRSLLNMRLQPGQGIAGWVARHGDSLIVDNVAEDPRFFGGADTRTGFQTRSLLCVPLHLQGRVLGVLQLVNKQDGNFSPDDLVFSETLAASAATALQNAQLVETLRQYTQQLEQQNEDLNAYAHTVAHDLKSPVARMVGFADLLSESHIELSPEERQQYLKVVAQNGHSLINIINELLLLANVRRARKVECGPVEMGGVVQAAQERLAHVIEENQAEIIHPSGWPVAIGYAPWLEEVWANYISNAIKYGGQPPLVELGADSLPSSQVRFWVRDNGPGLKPEEQERLFTPFTRLDQARARGHGLGLSIVRRIVEKLNGSVGVESQTIPGKGCTFWFTLKQAEGS